MARRFGGRFSPEAEATTPRDAAVRETVLEQRRIDAAGTRATLMFLPPALLAITSLGAGAAGLVMGLVGAGALALGAWLLREGLRAEAAYKGRTIARRPSLPRKILAAILTGLGAALAVGSGGATLVEALLYALAAGGLHLAAFGIDPLANKRMEGVDTFQQDRVARVVDEAEAYLDAMADHIGRLNDRRLDMRVAEFQALARRMIRTVEEDPRDLTAARKYLGVYLMGARDASVKFADHYRRTPDPRARAEYEALLDDLEANFAQRTEKMLIGDRTDMDIEIKVLRDRLARDGVRTG